jgi:hypothetical protein
MSTTTNAVEFCRFINELGDNYYFEDYADELWAELWDFDEKSKLWFVKPGKADREFVIENDFGGYIAWQGQGPDPYSGDRNTEIVFQEWRKKQDTKTVVVVVPNDKVDLVIVTLGNLGLNPILHG